MCSDLAKGPGSFLVSLRSWKFTTLRTRWRPLAILYFEWLSQTNVCFSDLISGRFVPVGITWMASDLGAVNQDSCQTLRKGNAAVPRIILIVMKTVTMKMLAVHSIQEVGANASGQVITWPVSTRATAMSLTALTNADAARWRKVILPYPMQACIENQLWSNTMH